MGDEKGKHVRRKRYRGNHPRSFSEKYKEHDPERYGADIEKVLSRGDTPAGSHRSIMVQEILDALAPQAGDRAIDATLGYGGHARAVIRRILPGGCLYGVDRDPGELEKTTARLLASGIPPEAFVPIHANFADLPGCLASRGVRGADLFLADLGLSSMQIDDPARGFSFKQKGPLDMRMDRGQGASARDFLAAVDEDKLRDILIANADEANATGIAHAICQRRGRLNTTRDLAEAISSALPGLSWKDPELTKALRRSFQAIRIEVNGEFASLDALLARLPAILNPGARAAILAFHSGEDRRVEAAFKTGSETGLYSSVSADVIRPGREERYGNPRSTSAKLRWAIRA